MIAHQVQMGPFLHDKPSSAWFPDQLVYPLHDGCFLWYTSEKPHFGTREPFCITATCWDGSAFHTYHTVLKYSQHFYPRVRQDILKQPWEMLRKWVALPFTVSLHRVTFKEKRGHRGKAEGLHDEDTYIQLSLPLPSQHYVECSFVMLPPLQLYYNAWSTANLGGKTFAGGWLWVHSPLAMQSFHLIPRILCRHLFSQASPFLSNDLAISQFFQPYENWNNIQVKNSNFCSAAMSFLRPISTLCPFCFLCLRKRKSTTPDTAEPFGCKVFEGIYYLHLIGF